MRIVSNIKILLECSSFVLSSNVPVVRGIKKSKVLEEALRVRTIFSNNSKLLIKNRITVDEAKSINAKDFRGDRVSSLCFLFPLLLLLLSPFPHPVNVHDSPK